MHLDILAIVLITATIQSLFGIGVLLFGTPILLVLHYPFVTVLATLLPISLAINLLQVSKHYRSIDRRFYRNILVLSVPGVVAGLLLVTKPAISIAPIIGTFLILVALKNLLAPVAQAIEFLVRFERSYFIVMGSVHGLTNLGGSLLSALIHSKPYDKDVARATTAASYGTFALFQLATLATSLERLPIAASDSLLYVAAGVIVFMTTEQWLHAKLRTERYRITFAIFLGVSGVTLILKSALT